MSTRRTTRRRRSRKHGTATLVAFTGLAGLAAYRGTLVLAIALAMTAGIVTTVAIIARRYPYLLTERQLQRRPTGYAAGRHAQRKAVTNGPRRIPPAATPAGDLPDGREVIANSAQDARDGRASARGAKLGWLPPRKAKLIQVSEQCADGQCHACPAPGQCEHCDHDPAEIVARNRAQYDAAQAATANGDVPPF
jgi:hypothetical protein